MSDSNVVVREDSGRTHVTIDGVISELFDPSAVPRTGFSAETPLTINLRRVHRITSSGVREWLRFIGTLKAGSFKLEECSVGFVQQMGNVLSFAPTASVVSLALPYYCDKCDLCDEVMVNLADARAHIDQPHPCSRCGANMVFDDLVDTYLGWIDDPPR